MEKASPNTLVCALSGISGPADVKAYQNNGVDAVLVGEALMRAEDPHDFANHLLGRSKCVEKPRERADTLVKICGTRTVEAASAAMDAGADMIGIILVKGRKRCVDMGPAKAISNLVHGSPRLGGEGSLSSVPEAYEYFEHTSTLLRKAERPLLVGVFQNQPLSYVLEQQRSLALDVVQLHGSEPIEWAKLIPVPVIRRFGPGDAGLGVRGYHVLPLLDSASGGTGEKLDSGPIRALLTKDTGLRVILAGGLNADNVENVLSHISAYSKCIVAVDVSSGVETDGVQDLDKIRRFIKAAKSR